MFSQPLGGWIDATVVMRPRHSEDSGDADKRVGAIAQVVTTAATPGQMKALAALDRSGHLIDVWEVFGKTPDDIMRHKKVHRLVELFSYDQNNAGVLTYSTDPVAQNLIKLVTGKITGKMVDIVSTDQNQMLMYFHITAADLLTSYWGDGIDWLVMWL